MQVRWDNIHFQSKHERRVASTPVIYILPPMTRVMSARCPCNAVYDVYEAVYFTSYDTSHHAGYISAPSSLPAKTIPSGVRTVMSMETTLISSTVASASKRQ
jgi:hypothetical protein